MITSVDTNILLDILVPNEKFCDASAAALEEAASAGSLVICDIVYAELCVHFETRRDCAAFLQDNEIRVQSLVYEAHFLASRVLAQVPTFLVYVSLGDPKAGHRSRSPIF